MANIQNNAALGAFADTGQWRLILAISPTGMSGLLKNILQPDAGLLPIFHRMWDADADLLDMVRQTVYDNPRMLDDFSTQIVITSPRTLWIPTELTEYEEFDENFYTSFYKAEYEDIFADFDDDEVCLYSPAPGLNSYLSRTLPGCRVCSHLSILKKHYRSVAAEGTHLFIDLREGECDLLAFSGGRLLSAASHPCSSSEEAAKYVDLLQKTYRLNSSDIRVHIYGGEESAGSLGERLSDHTGPVDMEVHPTDLRENGITHAMLLAAEK